MRWEGKILNGPPCSLNFPVLRRVPLLVWCRPFYIYTVISVAFDIDHYRYFQNATDENLSSVILVCLVQIFTVFISIIFSAIFTSTVDVWHLLFTCRFLSDVLIDFIISTRNPLRGGNTRSMAVCCRRSPKDWFHYQPQNSVNWSPQDQNRVCPSKS